MASLPRVQGLHEKYKSNPSVVILAMNVGDENEKMKSWWADKKYSFPTLNDADDMAKTYGIKAFPSSVLIGPDGKVLTAQVGSCYELEGELKKALAKSAKSTPAKQKPTESF